MKTDLGAVHGLATLSLRISTHCKYTKLFNNTIMTEKEFELYTQTEQVLRALEARYDTSEPWSRHESTTIVLPTRIEAPSRTAGGRLWQRIRKAWGKVSVLREGTFSPGMLGKEAAKIFDSFCNPATYNIVPTKETRIKASYQQPADNEYVCALTVCRGKQTVCRVRLSLSVSNGVAEIKVFAPLVLLARLIATGTARPCLC